MRVTYVNVRARHLLKKSMVRAPKNMAAIVIAIVLNLPGMSLQPLYTLKRGSKRPTPRNIEMAGCA